MAPPGTYVLRGGSFAGVSHLKNARDVYEAYGFWGICAKATPDRSPEEIVGSAFIGNKIMMIGVSNELDAEGFQVVQEPGKTWPNALITFSDVPSTDDWEKVHAALARRGYHPNPSYRGK